MIAELDTSSPSIRQLQSIIKQAQSIELKLLTGDTLTGKVLWQDPQCLCLVEQNNQQILVWKQAIAYIAPNRT